MYQCQKHHTVQQHAVRYGFWSRGIFYHSFFHKKSNIYVNPKIILHTQYSRQQVLIQGAAAIWIEILLCFQWPSYKSLKLTARPCCVRHGRQNSLNQDRSDFKPVMSWGWLFCQLLVLAVLKDRNLNTTITNLFRNWKHLYFVNKLSRYPIPPFLL